MSRKSAEKLFEKMKRSLTGWSSEDFETLYTGFGFDLRQGSGHTIYAHPDYPELSAAVGRHRALAKGYAEHAVKTIAKLKELEAERNR